MTPEQLKTVLSKHAKWLRNEKGGVCADLSGEDLRSADLSFVNLSRADLTCANLACADLRGSDLSRCTLIKANLSRADLVEANLLRANLRMADLTNSILWGTSLYMANLSGAVLRHAKYFYVPTIPNIHQAILEACTAPGCSLDMGVWHTCETTHCRGGWAVHLAGSAGRMLETWIGTNAAAALIYQASDPSLKRVPNWCMTNEDALADMRRLAGERAP